MNRVACVVLLLVPWAASAQDDSAAAEKFSAHVEQCTPGNYAHPHPLVAGFTSTHLIRGLDDDGNCRYSQTMPGGMHMECAFGEPGRAAFAREFEEMAAGGIQGGTKDASAWQRDCELVAPDGSRTKFSESGEDAG